MFNTSGCFDIGPFCGGWGHVVDKMNAELLEHVATIYYRALATGEEIQKLPSTAIDYVADKGRQLAKIKTLLLQRPKTRNFFKIFITM